MKKENYKLDYFAYLLTFIGLALAIEVIAMYVHAGVDHESFSRSHLISGWGVYNNVAGVMCMCVPAPIYLIIKKNKGCIYAILFNIIYLFTLLTQSRNGMIMSTLLYITGLAIILANTTGKKRISNIIVFGLSFLITLFVFVFQKEYILNIFNDIVEIGLESNGRIGLYEGGFSAFMQKPIFGTGFYDFEHSKSVYFESTSFLAPRYHNTIIQLLASTGILGFIAYFYHRIDTIRITFKNLTIEKGVIGLAISGILLTSLLDCHFFNFGPGLHYGILLFMLEMTYFKQDLKELVDE